ncbi:MAG: alanine racemase [Demequina sp.]
MTALRVEVDTEAIRSNIEVLGGYAGAAQVMAVVKADAYGHGLVPVAQAARAGGATWLGVAQPQEALALRENGDTGRVLTWLYGAEVDAMALVTRDIDVSVNSGSVLTQVAQAAAQARVTARVHVCVDTGLGREGVMMADLPALLDGVERVQAQGHIEVVGLWSHLAWADAPGHPTIDAQAEVFREARALVESRGIHVDVAHLANSAATLTRPDLHFDLVRPGIAVYGLPPVEDPDGASFSLRPAMTVRSTVALVKDVDAGQGVSYGHEYVASAPTRLALIPAGYADGIFRSVGNRAEVSIKGDRYPVRGRVCMDQFVVEVGRESSVREGDEVTLIGPDGPTAAEWAHAAGTIDYEVVCRFGDTRRRAEG